MSVGPQTRTIQKLEYDDDNLAAISLRDPERYSSDPAQCVLCSRAGTLLFWSWWWCFLTLGARRLAGKSLPLGRSRSPRRRRTRRTPTAARSTPKVATGPPSVCSVSQPDLACFGLTYLFILLAVLAHHSRLAALPADGSGRVVRWVDGRPSMVVQLPVPNATSCTFGGADLDTLYITTAARKDPNPSPSSGGLFAAKVGVAGLPEPYYIP